MPEDDFDDFIEAAETASKTQLPHDDFDENPFGHHLGLDDEPDQTVPYTEAQLAGPLDAVWLAAEEQTESEDEFLTNKTADQTNK